MKYSKPEVIMLESAVEAVRGTTSKEALPVFDQFNQHTIAAYEADE